MKINYLGRDMLGRFSSLKTNLKYFFKLVSISTLLVFLFLLTAYGFSESRTEYTAIAVETEAPVLQRIADCESGNGTKGSATHYKNGQVLLKANSNGTIDIGKYQVNLTYWGKKATELHYDLTKEADNKAMAEYIYANNGTGDWSASAKCWKK